MGTRSLDCFLKARGAASLPSLVLAGVHRHALASLHLTAQQRTHGQQLQASRTGGRVSNKGLLCNASMVCRSMLVVGTTNCIDVWLCPPSPFPSFHPSHTHPPTYQPTPNPQHKAGNNGGRGAATTTTATTTDPTGRQSAPAQPPAALPGSDPAAVPRPAHGRGGGGDGCAGAADARAGVV